MYYMYTRVALSWSVNWSSSNILCTKPAQHYNTCSTANKIWVFGIRRPAINQNEPNKSLCSNIFTNRLSALDSNQTNNSKNPTNSYHSLSKTNRTAPITPPTKINLSNHPPLIIFRYTTSPPCGLFLMPRWFEKKKNSPTGAKARRSRRWDARLNETIQNPLHQGFHACLQFESEHAKRKNNFQDMRIIKVIHSRDSTTILV